MEDKNRCLTGYLGALNTNYRHARVPSVPLDVQEARVAVKKMLRNHGWHYSIYNGSITTGMYNIRVETVLRATEISIAIHHLGGSDLVELAFVNTITNEIEPFFTTYDPIRFTTVRDIERELGEISGLLLTGEYHE